MRAAPGVANPHIHSWSPMAEHSMQHDSGRTSARASQDLASQNRNYRSYITLHPSNVAVIGIVCWSRGAIGMPDALIQLLLLEVVCELLELESEELLEEPPSDELPFDPELAGALPLALALPLPLPLPDFGLGAAAFAFDAARRFAPALGAALCPATSASVWPVSSSSSVSTLGGGMSVSFCASTTSAGGMLPGSRVMRTCQR